MAWSAVPVSAGDDMSLRSTYLELMGAWNERLQAIGSATVTNPAAGDVALDADSTYGIATMQTWIESFCTSFVQSHNSDGSARAAGYYDAAASITMWTLANLRQSAGLNASGFKKTIAPTYGLAAADDIVLVEHWNELRLMFNKLIWTKTTAAFSNHAENNLRQSGAFTGSFTTWNGAYAAALAAFNGAAATSSVGFNPTAYEFGSDAGGGTEPNRYHCELLRFYYYGEFSSIPTNVSHAMDAYVFTAKTQTDAGNNVYFDHGDGPPYAQDVFKLHQTFAAANTATRTTTKIGSVTTAPTQGPTPNTVGGRFYGWEQWPSGGAAERSFPIGVARWNVAGGFSYT